MRLIPRTAAPALPAFSAFLAAAIALSAPAAAQQEMSREDADGVADFFKSCLFAEQAQPCDLVDATDAPALAALLEAEGYGATLGTDDYGDPYIESAAEGLNFQIYFYGCEDGAACTDIQYHAGFNLDGPLSPEQMNDWNRGWRFGRLYNDDEGDPHLEYDVTLAGGVSRANFQDTFQVWRETLVSFKEHIGW